MGLHQWRDLVGGKTRKGRRHSQTRSLSAGQTEVDDPRPAILVDHHVAGLEVAMHDATRVGGGQSVTRCKIGTDDLFPASSGLALPVRQGLSFDELQHDVRAARIDGGGERVDGGVHLAVVGPPHAEDLHDRRMLDGGQRSRLAKQPSVFEITTAAQQLDRDAAPENAVVGLDHGSKGAGTQYAYRCVPSPSAHPHRDPPPIMAVAPHPAHHVRATRDPDRVNESQRLCFCRTHG